MAIKLYTKQYAGIVPDLFESRTHFLRSFGGTVQVHADAEYNDKFLTLKTTDTDVTIQAYSTDANVGFGTGTGSTSRFGPRHEVKSVDTTVAWETPLAIHDGIDRFTVNDIPTQVVAERLALHGAAWAEHVDGLLGKALSDNASETLTGELTEDGVVKAFVDARKAFVNNKVSRNVAWVAYVNTDVFNLLVDSKLATTAKNSSANIDNQTLYAFKGFVLQEIQDDAFETGEQIYFATVSRNLRVFIPVKFDSFNASNVSANNVSISSVDSISSTKSFSLARGVSVLFASFNTSTNVSASLLIKLGNVFSNPNRMVKPFDAIVCCLFNSFRNPKPNTKLNLSKIMSISPFL